jgi:hypothetical protein
MQNSHHCTTLAVNETIVSTNKHEQGYRGSTCAVSRAIILRVRFRRCGSVGAPRYGRCLPRWSSESVQRKRRR